MKIEVEVLLRNQVSLPETSICRVEVRDVSLLDAPSITICAYESPVTQMSGITVLTHIFSVPDRYLSGHRLNVWAHLSLTGSKRVQSGDYLTMQSYPISSSNSGKSISVDLQPVR